MNKTTEALKLAEEALLGSGYYDTFQQRKALAAIREALAEQEKQEPVAFYIYKPTPARFDQFKGGVLDGSLPWVYDQDPSSGFVARMLVTPCDAPVSVEAAVLAEREACAKVCEDLYKHLNYDADCRKLWPHTKMINDQYAAAIRGIE